VICTLKVHPLRVLLNNLNAFIQKVEQDTVGNDLIAMTSELIAALSS